MAAATDDVKTTDGGNFRRGGRQEREPRAQPKLFMPLPKPAHLVYIKPTVAVVADIASRNSVGVKMTAGDKKLESYVIEFYSRRL